MSAIRVQIYLKYFFDENSLKQFHNFWYAFEPSKLLTINDILEDIRLNYFKNQISLLVEEYEEQSFIIHLDDCQLLPFTSSQILRDNDRLTLMPLTKYKLHKQSFQDSINLDLPSSIPIEPLPMISENNHKRQRIEASEQNAPSESTITITAPSKNVGEQPLKKKTKTKSIEDHLIVPSITQFTPEPSVVQLMPQVLKEPVIKKVITLEPSAIQPISQITKETIIEKETTSEAPLSYPSTNGRIRELKSKTPTWKAQPPPVKGNAQDKVHIRFDSDSEEEPISQAQTHNEEQKIEEPLSQTQTHIEEKKIEETLPVVNGSNSSIRIHYVSSPDSIDLVQKPNETKDKRKTIDLLFEIKQHKNPDEKQAKKIQQQFGKKRAQHRKRALDYLSMANFVDHAFGLDKNELENQVSSNGYHPSSSPPQTLPTSFNKLARLPLVAEAIENSDKMYDLYPPVTQCPSIQTRIAFKLLELSEDFCPKMSAYKEGTVIDVNETTGELTIQLDQPFQTVFNQPSKFYAPAEDLIEEDLRTVILPFSDFNSVRLLSTSNENMVS